MKKETNNKIFYIDPQSMINLAKYDYFLLEGIQLPIYYFCSKYYDFATLQELHYKKVFGYNHKKYNWQKAISYILSYIQILCYALVLRPKVVHFQWFRIPRFDYWIVLLMQHVLGIKVIFTAHNILPHQGNESKKTAVFQKMYLVFDRIIVHSQNTKEELIQAFHVNEEKIRVIKHGVLPFDISKESYEKAEHSFKEKYDLEGKTVFSCLGFQNHYKGTDIIIKAWSQIPELCQNPKCRLLIIGKVNDVNIDFSPLDGINNVIVDRRRISDEEFVFLLRHTDVYLLPYRDISQSGALLTTITEHVPVVVTDIGGLSEPLSIAPIGWKIKHADAQELGEILLYLSKHPEETENVKKNTQAWQRVCDYYAWDDISRRTQQLYEELL